MLRNIHGFSQEEIAGKIDISRQAYAKWESGATVPDIEKCKRLADIYGVTIDSLITTETIDGKESIPPAPKGRNIWGSVTINERGQLVIPKAAREKFGLTGGQRLIVLSDDKEGIALVPAEIFEERMKKAMEWASFKSEEYQTKAPRCRQMRRWRGAFLAELSNALGLRHELLQTLEQLIQLRLLGNTSSIRGAPSGT